MERSEQENKKINAEAKIKLVKIEFDLGIEQDQSLYQKLQAHLVAANQRRTNCKIKMADILKLAIPKITEADILEFRTSTLSKKDKLALWAENFNRENQTQYSSEEFAVDILPTLSGKDLKRIQEISL